MGNVEYGMNKEKKREKSPNLDDEAGA